MRIDLWRVAGLVLRELQGAGKEWLLDESRTLDLTERLIEAAEQGDDARFCSIAAKAGIKGRSWPWLWDDVQIALLRSRARPETSSL